MIRHSSHSVTAVTLPHLYKPAEVAEALGCSEWWVKEQARQRRIPFTKPGGAYMFTADHVAEIVALFEQRPARPGWSASPSTAAPRSRSRTARTPEPSTHLTARTPRRALQANAQIAV